jgi:hypothetical protein
LLKTPAEQTVDVTQQVIRLLAPALDEEGGQLVGVAASHPAAGHGFLKGFLNPLATEHNEAEGLENSLDELFDQRRQTGWNAG